MLATYTSFSCLLFSAVNINVVLAHDTHTNEQQVTDGNLLPQLWSAAQQVEDVIKINGTFMVHWDAKSKITKFYLIDENQKEITLKFQEEITMNFWGFKYRPVTLEGKWETTNDTNGAKTFISTRIESTDEATISMMDITDHAENDKVWAEVSGYYEGLKSAMPIALLEPAKDIQVTQLQNIEQSSTLGRWGPILPWPHVPVAGGNLPDGRILTFSSNRIDSFNQELPQHTTMAQTWDYKTGAFIDVPNREHDMFCGGMVSLNNGDLLINGGGGYNNQSSLFDHKTNTWSDAGDMTYGRFYPTTISMPNDSVLTALGRFREPLPELWEQSNGWKVMPDLDLFEAILSHQYKNRCDNDPNNECGNDTDPGNKYKESRWWPLFNLAPNGKIFHSGPTPTMHYLDVTGDGTVQQVGSLQTDWYPKNGVTIMYGEGKLLTAGGYKAETDSSSTNKAKIIDITEEEPVIKNVAPMAFARKFHNSVVLPTGKVLVIGGNVSGQRFSDESAVLTPEVFDPVTETWANMADMAVPRTYHSMALLLPDGTVFSGGGGLCDDDKNCANNHLDAEIYSPPYLFNTDGSLATRPIIEMAPEQITNNMTFEVDASDNIVKFTMIRFSMQTHQQNTSLRLVNVDFNELANGKYHLSAHQNKNVLTPGLYMLFAIDDEGVPSVSKTIKVSMPKASIFPIISPGETLSIEAESANSQPLFTPFEVINDNDASNGNYIVWPHTDNHQQVAIPDEQAQGLASYTFNLTQTAPVALSITMRTPQGNQDDSFYYRIDDGAWATQNNWQTLGEWKSRLITTFIDLPAGEHTLFIARRENGTEIDKITLMAQ